jgi:hypothetical protein
MEGKSRAAEGVKIALGQTDIDRFAEDMQAVRNYFAVLFSEFGIGDRAAISGNDVKRLIGLKLEPQGVQKIEKG